MAASVSGHKGGLPLTELLDMIDRYAYRQRHVAWNRVGVKRGLPPDVATVQLGMPEDGTWWNLKRGMIPEVSVRKSGGVRDNEETLELMHKHGMHPLAQQTAAGYRAPDGSRPLSLFNERTFKQYLPSKLLYIGWRAALKSMLVNYCVRPNPTAERLLGTKEYRQVMQERLLRQTVHYDGE